MDPLPQDFRMTPEFRFFGMANRIEFYEKIVIDNIEILTNNVKVDVLRYRRPHIIISRANVAASIRSCDTPEM